MPLVEYVSSQGGDAATRLAATTRAVVETLGKPQRSVMVQVQTATASFGGSLDPSCCIRVSQIGEFGAEARDKLAHQLTWLAAEHLRVHEERVLVAFSQVARDRWGVGGRLFGTAKS